MTGTFHAWRLVRLAPLVLFAGFGTGASTQAELMRYQYSGVVTSITQAPSDRSVFETTPGGPGTFDGIVAVGQRFAGTFSYDPAEAPNPNAAPPGGGVSQHYGSLFGVGTADADEMTATVGGKTFLNQSAGGLQITPSSGYNAPGMPATTNVLFSNQYVSDLFPTEVGLNFEGGNPTLYPLTGPPAQLNLGDFNLAEFSARAGTFGELSFRGTIDSLSLITSTPEPSPWLILSGAALIHLARRRFGRNPVLSAGDGR